MNKRSLIVDEVPIQHKNQPLRMTKPYTKQDYTKHTVLTDDVFTYVSFFFDTHSKTMRYADVNKKVKYGAPDQYNYKFYWKQAEIFYKAAKSTTTEASPVAAYYCILNAVKAYLSYTSKYVDDFVEEFGMHGVYENLDDLGDDLSTISISHRQKGVFPLFAKTLDNDFEVEWPHGKNNSRTLKDIMYNLSFVHRAYVMTYVSRNKTVEELFVPLKSGEYPKFYKGSDGKAYLLSSLDKSWFSMSATKIPITIQNTIPDILVSCENDSFTLRSTNGFKRNVGSVSSEIKENTAKYRKHFSYIRGNKRLWFLKCSKTNAPGVINLSSMTLTMAAMHRISEIARYKPEQLNRLLQSKENWLLHEFISLALDQFIDEISCEITHQEIMPTADKG